MHGSSASTLLRLVCEHEECKYSIDVFENELSPDLLTNCQKCGRDTIDSVVVAPPPDDAEKDLLGKKEGLIAQVEADNCASIKRILSGVHFKEEIVFKEELQQASGKRKRKPESYEFFQAIIKPEDIDRIRAPCKTTGKLLVHHVPSRRMLSFLRDSLKPPLILHADINAQDGKGRTRLHMMCDITRAKLTVEDLIREGCDSTIRNFEGKTAYDEVIERTRRTKEELQNAEHEKNELEQALQRAQRLFDALKPGCSEYLRFADSCEQPVTRVEAKTLRDQRLAMLNRFVREEITQRVSYLRYLKILEDALNQHPGGAAFDQQMSGASVSFSFASAASS